MPQIQRVWDVNLQVYGADKSVAANAPRGLCDGALYDRAIDAADAVARRSPWQGRAHHHSRSGRCLHT